jgi:SlyX protein
LDIENRLIDLEIKLANQENMLEQLSAIIYDQQKQIDKLERAAKELEKNNIFDFGQHNVKPPHY